MLPYNDPFKLQNGADMFPTLKRSRQPTLPPLSNRTLHHPSFQAVYMVSGFPKKYEDCCNQTAHPITIPADFFYTDPTMTCGRRIPNLVSEFKVFDCFQLITPPPVMSACPTPPACPDPFRSRPSVELGSLTLQINVLHPPLQPNRLVLQLTQEEDQAVTNLLKLHYQQQPAHRDETTLLHAGPLESSSADEGSEHFHPSKASLISHKNRWSDTELEAANTLLSGFSSMEVDKIWNQIQSKLAEKHPDPGADLLQGSETSSVSETRVCDGEDAEASYGDYLSESKSRICGEVSEVKKLKLSESEGDAVNVLLSLADTTVLMQ